MLRRLSAFEICEIEASLDVLGLLRTDFAIRLAPSCACGFICNEF
ncbi:hypothetical protein Trydic_g19796, partial [Trypoxylus dichotomus]